jgi:hypothetical protein
MAQEILPQYMDRGKDCKNCDRKASFLIVCTFMYLLIICAYTHRARLLAIYDHLKDKIPTFDEDIEYIFENTDDGKLDNLISEVRNMYFAGIAYIDAVYYR